MIMITTAILNLTKRFKPKLVALAKLKNFRHHGSGSINGLDLKTGRCLIYGVVICCSRSIIFVQNSCCRRNIPFVCNRPDNISDIFTYLDDDAYSINTSEVHFEKCNILVGSNGTGSWEGRQLPCVYGYNFSERQDLSIVSDMEMVCEKAPIRSLGQTLMIGGQGIGAFILPFFSDRFGRRPLHLFSHVSVLLLGVGVAFSPSYTVFLVIRLFVGIFQQGIVLTDATIGIEVFPTRHRSLVAFLSNIGWCICSLFLPFMAYVLRDQSWRILQLGCCSVSVVVIIQFFFLDESIRWMVANNKTKQLEKVLKKASRISGVDHQHVMNVYRDMMSKLDIELNIKTPDVDGEFDDVIHDIHDSKDYSHSLLDFLRVKRLGLNVALLWCIWLIDSMTYFGLFFTSDTLAGDRFVNVVLLTVVQMPSSIFIYVLIDRIGRKKTCMALHGIALFGLVGATVFKSVLGATQQAAIASTTFACFGFFGIFGGFGALFFYTPEIYPTNMRNVGLGTASSFSRIGGMVAPFAGLLAEYKTWAPGSVLAACCLAAIFFLLVLPETKGKELPQTISEVKSWYKKLDQEDRTEMKDDVQASKDKKS